MADLKEHAHELIERLEPTQLPVVVEMLESILAEGALATDEDEISEATAAAIERARGSLRRGEGVAHEDVLREFGVER